MYSSRALLWLSESLRYLPISLSQSLSNPLPNMLTGHIYLVRIISDNIPTDTSCQSRLDMLWEPCQNTMSYPPPLQESHRQVHNYIYSSWVYYDILWWIQFDNWKISFQCYCSGLNCLHENQIKQFSTVLVYLIAYCFSYGCRIPSADCNCQKEIIWNLNYQPTTQICIWDLWKYENYLHQWIPNKGDWWQLQKGL